MGIYNPTYNKSTYHLLRGLRGLISTVRGAGVGLGDKMNPMVPRPSQGYIVVV